jgi:hypothetical protein
MFRPCDDKFGYRILDNGTLLIGVADGAGSAKRGAEGAAIAIEAMLDSAEKGLADFTPVCQEEWETFLASCLLKARLEIEALAVDGYTAGPGHLHEFATTMVFVAVTAETVGACHVGDGAVVVRTTDGGLDVMAQFERGEYLNETVFLTSPEYPERVAYELRPTSEISAVALMSDGVECIAFDSQSRSAHAPFFQPMFRFAEAASSTEDELARFLASERVCAVTDDDKTIVLAVKQP